MNKNFNDKVNLCDYSDAYIHVKGTIEVWNTRTAAALNNRNKKATFKNCASFVNFISEINNTQVDDAHGIDVVMSMYNLIEFSDTYSRTSGSLWIFYKVTIHLKLILIFLLITITVFCSNINSK